MGVFDWLDFGVNAANFGGNLVGGLLNYDMQKQNLQYQKDLQEKMFKREDNAVQRRTADMKAAGINPILAAGQGASAGPVVSTAAPQMDVPQISNNFENKFQNQQLKINERVAAANLLKMDAEISHTKADELRIRHQMKIDNQKMRDEQRRLGHEDSRMVLDIYRYNIELARLGLDTDRLDSDIKHRIIEADKLELEREKHELEKNKFVIESLLNTSRRMLVDEQRMTERLTQYGVQADTARKLLDNQITLHDYQLALNAGLRYKDSYGQAVQVGMSYGNNQNIKRQEQEQINSANQFNREAIRQGINWRKY